MHRGPCVLFLLLVAAFAAAAPAVAKVRRGPAGSAFYTPPHHLPGHRHGDLIWARKLTGMAKLPGAARNELLLYRSTSVAGGAIAVSGTLALPKGKAPRGGWPVITWAHGTTGIADSCAPSLPNVGDSYVHPLLRRWLEAGYAIVRTDYEGLGTPGTHPYLVGRSEGRSVLDAVRAARRFAPRIGRRVVISGHSQGGHAALWAAALARRWTPELKVRGTVAFAPASHVEDQAKLIATLSAPNPGISALASLIVRGVDTADPSLGIPALLSPRAAALYPQTLTSCLGALAAPTSFGGLPPAQMFSPGADLSRVDAALGANDPEHLHIRTPVRIEQGDADTTVFKVFTDQLARDYRSLHVKVGYKTYKGVDHVGVVTAGASDATRWIRTRLRR